MARTVYILNGPDLNRLGVRKPTVCGTETLAAIREHCKACAATGGSAVHALASVGAPS